MPIPIVFVVLSIIVLIDQANSDQSNRAIDIEWEPIQPPFDPDIYEEILNPELCAKQIQHLIWNDTVLKMTCKYYVITTF